MTISLIGIRLFIAEKIKYKGCIGTANGNAKLERIILGELQKQESELRILGAKN